MVNAACAQKKGFVLSTTPLMARSARRKDVKPPASVAVAAPVTVKVVAYCTYVLSGGAVQLPSHARAPPNLISSQRPQVSVVVAGAIAAVAQPASDAPQLATVQCESVQPAARAKEPGG